MKHSSILMNSALEDYDRFAAKKDGKRLCDRDFMLLMIVKILMAMWFREDGR